MASTREKPGENRIKKVLRARGAWVLKTQAGGWGGIVGCPDLLCCYRGRFVAIEVKAPGKEANSTAKQVTAQNALRAAGALVMVASDVPEVTRALNLIDEQLDGPKTSHKLTQVS